MSQIEKPEALVVHVSKYLDGLDRDCNHNCMFCIERMEPGGSNRMLPMLDDIITVLNEARDKFGIVETVHIAGGETTLRNDLSEIIHAATKVGRKVCLSTHGDLIDPGSIGRQIHDAGATEVGLSLHGSCSEVHDKLTQTDGSFLRTLDTASTFAQLGLVVHINCVVSSFNIHQLSEIIKVARNIKPDLQALSFTHYANHGNAFYYPELSFNIDECNKYITTALDEANRGYLRVLFRDFPLCLDDRLVQYQEQVDKIVVIKWDKKQWTLVPEKAPAFWMSKCHACNLLEWCPGYLLANYG